MDTQEALTARIESYLEGTLDAAQQADFERQLLTDPQLQNAVYRHRKAAVAINYALNQSMKARLKTIDQEATQPISRSRFRIRLQRLAAAASVLILVAAGFHFYAYRTYSADHVAARLFVHAQPEIFRGDDVPAASSDDLFTQAEQLFQEASYDQAAQMYLPIINGNSMLKGQAEWNLAMCYYASDPSSSRFKILFDQILADTNHDYHTQAVKLRDVMHGTLYKIVNR